MVGQSEKRVRFENDQSAKRNQDSTQQESANIPKRVEPFQSYNQIDSNEYY